MYANSLPLVRILTAYNASTVHSCIHQGRIQKFQKGGAGSRILERRGWNLTFQCRFPSFSYKSLTNIPPKGGAAACPAPPLNPRLFTICLLRVKLFNMFRETVFGVSRLAVNGMKVTFTCNIVVPKMVSDTHRRDSIT